MTTILRPFAWLPVVDPETQGGGLRNRKIVKLLTVLGKVGGSNSGHSLQNQLSFPSGVNLLESSVSPLSA